MKILIIILLSGYGLICIGAFLMQARLVFFPSDEDAGNPGDIDLDFEDVRFRNSRGHVLNGWYVRSPRARFTLLYCHGNAGNITHRVDSIKQFVEAGLSVFIFDYAGYGRSEGRATEAGTYDDALAAWQHLTEEIGLEEREIIVYGRSLGGAVAIELATRVDVRAMILESCFTSMPEMGARVYPWLPVRFLTRIHYDSISRIPSLNMPKLFVHSLEDEVVPYGMGRRLYNRAPRPKKFVKLRGGHNEAHLTSGSNYQFALREFLDGLEVPFTGPQLIKDKD